MSRHLPLLAFTSIMTIGFSAAAEETDAPLQGTHPFFVEDAADSRVLHATEELFDKGPDRELLQALSTPRISEW